jgi:hypothetical protein
MTTNRPSSKRSNQDRDAEAQACGHERIRAGDPEGREDRTDEMTLSRSIVTYVLTAEEAL